MSSKGKKTSKGTKLSIVVGRGFAIIIIVALISGVVSIVGAMSIDDEYQGIIDGAIELHMDSDEIAINLLQARIEEKDFIATGDSDKLVTHDEYIEEIIEITDEIIEEAVSTEGTKIAGAIKSSVEIYDTKSHATFDLLIERGGGVFGADNGTVGDFRAAASEVDEMVAFDYEADLMNETVYLDLHARYLDFRSDEANYLLTRNTGGDYLQYIEHIAEDIPEFLEIIDTLNLATIREDEYHSDLDTYLSFLAAVVTIDDEIDILITSFTIAANEVEADAADLEVEAVTLLAAASLEVEQSVQNTLIQIISLVVIVILIGIALTVILTRGIVNPVYEIGSEVDLIGKGDLTSVFEFDKAPSAELRELGDNIEHMKESLLSVIGSVASSSKILNESSEDIFSGSEEINASAEEVASTSQAMSDGATSQTELIAEVNDDIKDITGIVGDIIKKIQANTDEVSQIALQTNILALNAGIEASRAGDYGRGFAVVAESVRRLSDQSKTAADQIALVAEDISTSLLASFNKISASMFNIVSVSEETASSAEEVAAAAEEMTATIEELSSAAQELTTQAENSLSEIRQFKLPEKL
jgi:methyl-accepting chemotaxis protein